MLTAITAQIGDGHTSVLLTKLGQTFLSQQANVFPLAVQFIDSKLYVVGTTTDAIARGCELTSIEDTPVPTIVAKMMSHVSGDGANETRKYRAVGQRFAVDYYLYLGQPDRFRVGCGRGTVTVQAMPEPEAAKLRAAHGARATPQPPPFKLEILALPGVAIGTFSDDSFDGTGFIGQLTAAFEQIATHKITDLIIDMRGNDGGDDLGPQLFEQFAARDFQWVDRIEAATKTLERTRRYTHLDDAFVTKFADSLGDTSGGRSRVKPAAEPLLGIHKRVARPFAGRVWMIVDVRRRRPQRAPRHHRRRGNRWCIRGNSAGEFVAITLPETQLKVVVPLEEFVMAVLGTDRKDRGVIPDIPVVPTIDDVLAGTDPELAATLAAIAKRR